MGEGPKTDNSPTKEQSTFEGEALISKGLVSLPPSLRPSSVSPVQRLKHWMADEWEVERNKAEMLPWMVVAFMTGIAIYFAVPQEPSLPVLLCLVVAFGIYCWHVRKTYFRFVLAASIFALLFGFSAATLETFRKHHPILTYQTSATLSGVVLKKEVRPTGLRFLVRLTDWNGTAKPPVELVRLSVRKQTQEVEVGDLIKVRAQLGPPGGPSLPGGYDFSRAVYFEEIGATGFTFGSLEKVGESGKVGTPSDFFQYLRLQIAERVRESMATVSDEANLHAAVVNAILVGERGGIDRSNREVLARSGLAHLLAISGLHMALVVSGVILGMRFLLAGFGEFVLRHQARRVAVLTGILVGSFYFALSGGSISAQRAFVMVSIIALALLLSRRALTHRNIAVAAFLLLIFTPSFLLSAGLQMSFAATLALISAYRFYAERSYGAREKSGGSMHRKLLGYAVGVAATSLIAGTASGIYAAYHFNEVAPFGLAANLVAVPLFSFLVMPFAFLTLVLMPFGAEALSLVVLDKAIAAILTIATWTAEQSDTLGLTGQMSSLVLLGATAGLLILCVGQSKLRIAGLALIIVSLFFPFRSPPPEIQIAADGKTVAVYDDDREVLVVSGARSGRFEIRNWLKAYALPNGQSISEQNVKPDKEVIPNRDKWICDKSACTYTLSGYRIAHVKALSAFELECRNTDILVTQLTAPAFCTEPSIVIDKRALASRGAHAIKLPELSKIADRQPRGDYEVNTAIPEIKRPWHAGFQTN